jgi:glutathione S-transferase
VWTADLIGLSYSNEVWGLPHRDPARPIRKLNPNAQVPVILEDGFVLWESGAIMLPRRATSQQTFTSTSGKSAGRPVADLAGDQLNPPWGYAVALLLRTRPTPTENEYPTR